MVRVFRESSYSVYVYDERGQPHKGAHCHVRFPDHEVVLMLPTLTQVGEDVSRAVREQLLEHLEEITEVWDELNG